MRDDNALTADEVAKALQVSRSMVYKLVKADELASYYVGRKMRFTMGDVENYVARAKRVRSQASARSGAVAPLADAAFSGFGAEPSRSASPSSSALVLAGNDIIGDVLANYLSAADLKIERAYVGSYDALVDLYRGRSQASLIHLLDGDTETYNVPQVKSLFPGQPVKVIRLVRRRQGLIVAKGNPLNLRTWEDVLRPGVRIVNRELGCGSRVLLDEKLCRLGVARETLEGYGREANSALSMASFVARGAADVGVGSERVFRQVEGVDFLPLQDEWLDMALAKRPGCERMVGAISNLTRTRPFREEIGGIVGYDVSRMGEVVFER